MPPKSSTFCAISPATSKQAVRDLRTAKRHHNEMERRLAEADATVAGCRERLSAADVAHAERMAAEARAAVARSAARLRERRDSVARAERQETRSKGRWPSDGCAADDDAESMIDIAELQQMESVVEVSFVPNGDDDEAPATVDGMWGGAETEAASEQADEVFGAADVGELAALAQQVF